MQLIRQHVAVIMAAMFLAVFVSGCDQAAKQTNSPDSTEGVASSQQERSTESSSESSKGKPSVDLSRTATYKLLVMAERSLYENDVDAAIAAIAEARQRKDLSFGFKMDVAKILFGAGKMKESAEVYDEVLTQQPDIKPQLWQRGLALYYAEQFEKGVDQFDTHQTYNSQDVENSVWHLLCQSRLTSVEEARKSMIQIEEDSRVPMKQVFDMFAGKGSPEQVIAASGYDEDNIVRNGSTYHGWLYVGLFHEMMGDQKAANEAMKTALKCKPIIPGLMGFVAEGHLRVRGDFPSAEE